VDRAWHDSPAPARPLRGWCEPRTVPRIPESYRRETRLATEMQHLRRVVAYAVQKPQGAMTATSSGAALRCLIKSSHLDSPPSGCLHVHQQASLAASERHFNGRNTPSRIALRPLGHASKFRQRCEKSGVGQDLHLSGASFRQNCPIKPIP